MKNTYIIIIVLVVLVGGGLFFLGMGNKVEAPTSETPMPPAPGSIPPVSVSIPPVTPPVTSSGVPCTMDAKVCSDGSFVGRVGPKCEFAACPSDTPALKEFVVVGKNFSFTPSTITVKKGDRVKITFDNTGGFHDFKIDEFGVATKQANSPDTEVLEFTADKTGSFQYYCSVGQHRAMGMWGTLVVQ